MSVLIFIAGFASGWFALMAILWWLDKTISPPDSLAKAFEEEDGNGPDGTR